MKDFDIRQIQPGVTPKSPTKSGSKESTGNTQFDQQLQSELQSTVKGMDEISSQTEALRPDDIGAARDMAQKLLEQANTLAKMYLRITGKEHKP